MIQQTNVQGNIITLLPHWTLRGADSQDAGHRMFPHNPHHLFGILAATVEFSYLKGFVELTVFSIWPAATLAYRMSHPLDNLLIAPYASE
jgi:hypothetical protein